MSLILDALKRAERERQALHSPILTDPNLPSGARRQRRWPRWAAALVALAIAGIGVTWWLQRPAPSPERAAAPSAPRVAERAPVEPRPAPAPGAAAPQAAAPPSVPPAVLPGTESVASLDDVGAEPEPLASGETTELEDVDADPAEPAPTPAPVQARPAPPPAAPEEQPETSPPPAATRPQPSPPAPARASPPLPAALTQNAPPRKLREMPPEYRADFPALSVDVHVHERDASRRFVMINGRRYKEGERMAEGPTIVEIVADGIVFDHRGQKVLYTLTR